MQEAELTAALSYFPFVGLIIGYGIMGVDWVLRGYYQAPVLGIIETMALAFVTRGLHLDGLVDTFDAIGSGRPAEDALRIMKDSHIGALGAVSLILVLLLKASALSEVSRRGLWQVVVLAPCLSRWGLNVLAASSDYARPAGGLGQAFVGRKTWRTLPVSGLSALAAAWFLAGIRGVEGFFGVIFWSLVVAFYFRRRLGGVTGDVLGAHLELTETLLMLAGAASFSGGV